MRVGSWGHELWRKATSDMTEKSISSEEKIGKDEVPNLNPARMGELGSLQG